MENNYIFTELDNLLNKIKFNPINESTIDDDDLDEIEPSEFETEEQARDAARKKVLSKLKSQETTPKAGTKAKMEMDIDDSIGGDAKSKSSGNSEDKTFHENALDDEFDDNFEWDDDDFDGEDDDLDGEDDDYEFDDFDYTDKHDGKSTSEETDDKSDKESGSGETGETKSMDDDEFADDDLGDDEDWDLGGDAGDEYDDEGDGDGYGDGDGDIDYDDTLDYDSAIDDNNLEDAIKKSFDRIKDDENTSDSLKDTLEDMKSKIDDPEGLSKQIDDMSSGKKSEKSEIPGEMLDDVPSDESFRDDMKSGGFSDDEISDMLKEKEEDMSDLIDDDKIKKEAIEDLDKKAKEKGEGGSALAKTITTSLLSNRVEEQEWKSIIELFLKQRTKFASKNQANSKQTAWGHKNHLWRDAILPKNNVSGGDIQEINVFIDFSGSVQEKLVYIFLQRIFELCKKFMYSSVIVYGFGTDLHGPIKVSYTTLKNDKPEDIIKKLYEDLSSTSDSGAYENFNVVAEEVNKIKKKSINAIFLLFGDGYWGMSYPNPQPPIRLKEKCSRYLNDFCVLVYYNENAPKESEDMLDVEINYLKKMVGLKRVVKTGIKKF